MYRAYRACEGHGSSLRREKRVKPSEELPELGKPSTGKLVVLLLAQGERGPQKGSPLTA